MEQNDEGLLQICNSPRYYPFIPFDVLVSAPFPGPVAGDPASQVIQTFSQSIPGRAW